MEKQPGIPWIMRKELSGDAVCNGNPIAKDRCKNRDSGNG